MSIHRHSISTKEGSISTSGGFYVHSFSNGHESSPKRQLNRSEKGFHLALLDGILLNTYYSFVTEFALY